MVKHIESADAFSHTFDVDGKIIEGFQSFHDISMRDTEFLEDEIGCLMRRYGITRDQVLEMLTVAERLTIETAGFKSTPRDWGTFGR